MQKKPEWIRTKICVNANLLETDRIVSGRGLHTVCRAALCPNRAECWGSKTASFMILGEVCTRNCRFCGVSHGRPLPPDPREHIKLAEAIRKMGLKYAVITSVTRDDLPDGGASHWAGIVRHLRREMPELKVEILAPDFQGNKNDLSTVFEPRPDVFAHNLETVKRLQFEIRQKADYATSLNVLECAADFGLVVKSGIMLGLGETEAEIEETLCDLKNAGVSILTLGQYMRPSQNQVEVARWVKPQEFEKWQKAAMGMGFRHVFSGPLVRSSYMAHKVFMP